MLELGHAAEELHRQVGRYAAEHGVDLLIGVRGAARAMVDEAVARGHAAERRAFFRRRRGGRRVRRGRWRDPGDAILFKGSRGVHVERALERFAGLSPCSTSCSTNSFYRYVSPFRVFRYITSARRSPASRRCSCASRWGRG